MLSTRRESSGADRFGSDRAPWNPRNCEPLVLTTRLVANDERMSLRGHFGSSRRADTLGVFIAISTPYFHRHEQVRRQGFRTSDAEPWYDMHTALYLGN